MSEEKIKAVVTQFAEEAKKIYGMVLKRVILYGSCAWSDFAYDSNIDIMLLLDIAQEKVSTVRKQILDISNQLDLEYDVV